MARNIDNRKGQNRSRTKELVSNGLWITAREGALRKVPPCFPWRLTLPNWCSFAPERPPLRKSPCPSIERAAAIGQPHDKQQPDAVPPRIGARVRKRSRHSHIFAKAPRFVSSSYCYSGGPGRNIFFIFLCNAPCERCDLRLLFTLFSSRLGAGSTVCYHP